MKRIRIVGMGLLLVVSGAIAGNADRSGPVAFPAVAKVWIDAEGVPSRVEASDKLPALVRPAIEDSIAGWRFEPAKVDGVAMAGITFVSVRACAMEGASGEMRFAVDYTGNGPGRPDGMPMLPAPRYPEVAARMGYESDWILILGVDSEGRATLESIDLTSGPVKRGKFFKQTLQDWVSGLKFTPEQVGGHGVATRMRVPVNFSMRMSGKDQKLERERREDELGSRACMAAKGDQLGPRPVAIDSPFRLRPAVPDRGRPHGGT